VTVPASTTVERVRAPALIPPASVLRHLPTAGGCAIVRAGSATVIGVSPTVVRAESGADAFAVLREVDAGGFWIGACAYDLGRSIERVHERTGDVLCIPDVAFARYDNRIVLHDDGAVEIVGDGVELRDVGAAVREAGRPPSRSPTNELAFQSSLDRVDHAAACARIHELLEAGECYQVNLTRRLRAKHAPDPVDLYEALTRSSPAPYAGLCTFPGLDLAIVSASPELFLRIDPDRHGRRIETRPIKGTAADATTLATSAKDRAENVMIVDLARNDLGRVCEYGSVNVPELCAVEPHPGLFHLVSMVAGRLRADVDFAAVVRATFPPASVTGAPKPRVMQAIEDLEPVRRGVYCGAVGWVDGDRGAAELAVAIRTFTITRGHTYLCVGGGIVADSHAGDEWAETELKAARLLAAAGAAPQPVSLATR
jgi:para-aminobenzoate synthetase component I